MKKQLIALAIALFLSPIFAGVEATLSNHLYYSDDSAILNINVDEEYIGLATLKICLSNYDFSKGSYSSKCDSLLAVQNISIINQYSDYATVNLNNIPSSVYRFYIQLSYKLDGTTKTRTDCDDGNFILIKPRTATEYVMKDLSGITLSIITQSNASFGEKVSAMVNITNYDQGSQILLYSYIKNETDYINENLNDDSFKILNITAGSSAIILMKNKLLENISEGMYDYIIKADSETNTYQTFNSIEIINDKIIELPKTNFSCPTFEECVCETITCPQTINQTQNISEGQTSKITAQLNLKRDEYYYIPAILIGLISLIIMYVKIK